MRVAGQDIAKVIPAGATLTVFDPRTGFGNLILKYEVLGFSPFNPAPRFIYGISSGTSSWSELAPRLVRHGISHIWIHQTAGWYARRVSLPEIREDGSTLVVKSDDSTWQIEKFWPYDGYTIHKPARLSNIGSDVGRPMGPGLDPAWRGGWVIKYRQDFVDRLAGQGRPDITPTLHRAPCRRTKRHRRAVIQAEHVLAHLGHGPAPAHSKPAVKIVVVRLISRRFCLPNCKQMFHRVQAPFQ